MVNSKEISKAIIGFSFRLMFNLLLVVGLVEAYIYSYHFSYKLFANIPYKPTQKQNVTVVIPEGSNAMEVADIMEVNGLVDGKYLILARMYIGGYNNKIQAGTYMISPSMTPDGICKYICGIKDEDKS